MSEASRNGLAYAIASFDPIYGYPPEVGTVLRWVPALIVAAALIWCGVRPLSRLVVWLVGLCALWMLPAVFTAISSALGMRVLDGDLREDGDAAGGGGAGDCDAGGRPSLEDHCRPGR